MANTTPTFNTGDGKLTTDFGGNYDQAYSIVRQGDGKILVSGYTWDVAASQWKFAVARYNADGALDTGFGTGGKVATVFGTGTGAGNVGDGYSIALQADGKFVVAGYMLNASNNDFAVARYNADGSLDTSFSSDGLLTTDLNGGSNDIATSVIIQADGKILVAGESHDGSNYSFALTRYNTNGTLDATFDGDGKLVLDAASTGGEHDYGRSVAVQPDGKIVVVGFDYDPVRKFNDMTLVRLNADGSVDGVRHGSIIGADSTEGHDVTILPDGKILVSATSITGNVGDFALVRYNPDLSPDITFETDGGDATDVGTGDDHAAAIYVQANGKILQAGYATSGTIRDFAMVRYHEDGTLDATFGDGGIVITSFGADHDQIRSITVQPDGKILVAGFSGNTQSTDFALARYNPDGSLDKTFDADNTLNGNPSFFENGPVVVLDTSIAVYDGELAATGNYAGAHITLARNGGANAEDVFSATGNLSFDGGNVLLAGTQIGTVLVNNGKLQLLFNADATQARVDAALSAIAYQNTSSTPPASVQIDWTFSDGNTGAQGSGGALSATGSTTVMITSVNSIPTGTDKAFNMNEDGNHTFAVNDFGFSDGDGGGGNLHSVRIDALPAAGALKLGGVDVTAGQVITAANLGTLVFTPVANDHGTGYASLTFSVKDQNNAFDTTPNTLTFNVASVNDTPKFSQQIPNLYKAESKFFSINLPAAIDQDIGDHLTYQLRIGGVAGGYPLPSWLEFDASTLTFSGTPVVGVVGPIAMEYSVIDSAGDIATSTFYLYTQPMKSIRSGNNSNNTLKGTAGNDILDGLGGNDVLDGGKGVDRYAGGTGNDIFLLDNLLETEVTEYQDEGNDTIKLKVNLAGNYEMADNIENIILTGTGQVGVTGNDLNNTLTGNAKANQLDGAAGNDSLSGGLGKDLLSGGDGADHFIFNTRPSLSNVDTITDFVGGVDVIVLDSKMFSLQKGDADLSDNFEIISTGGKATDSNNFLLYESSTGSLYYDVDGSKSKAAVLVGIFDDGSGFHPILSATDFVIG